MDQVPIGERSSSAGNTAFIQRHGGDPGTQFDCGNMVGSELKIENFSFRRYVNQIGATVQTHIFEKIGFVYLTIFSAGNSDADGYFFFL
jgi:hypothetical protein